MFIDIDEEKLTEIFENNLLSTNRGYNYYINWKNVNDYQPFLVELNAMNVLIRCQNFYDTFCELLEKLPSVVLVFPYLFSLAKVDRKKLWKGKSNLKVIGAELDSDDYQNYSFSKDTIKFGLSKAQINNYYEFFIQMGLKSLFENLIEKSVIDYVIGVLVGMDSNGRKNRGGKAFELACEPLITMACNKYNISLIAQKSFKELTEKGFENISDDIANRKADFILYDAKNKVCMNIEVNFYNGGGSKPEEIIDSYINRQHDLAKSNIKFALITDGNCWAGTTNQLKKRFKYLDFLMNFKIAKQGMLNEVIERVFYS